jgi:hypothetical protein
MKYDIHQDEIIVKIPTQTITHTFQLIKEKVDRFSINDSDFIPLTNLRNLDEGFYEIIFESSTLTFYKKNVKTSNKYFYNSSLFYKFKNRDQYVLYSKSEYHKITKLRKNLIRLFPKYENNIKVFFESQSDLLKINYDLFIKNLITELNDSLSE